MEVHFDQFWISLQHMVDATIARLPSVILGAIVFALFYLLSALVSQFIRRTTRGHRENLGMVFARLAGAATVLLGFLVAFSVVAPSFQAGDLIKLLGIGSVAIGFAFQNILQNFLAGLLLLWSEPFRIGDDIKLDAFEGTVEDIQARATIIRTYDERAVVIPNAELFTHSVVVNTARANRRWEYAFTVSGVQDLNQVRARILHAMRNAPGTLTDPPPQVLVSELGDLKAGVLKLRALWWTQATHNSRMLTSYDAVLTSIQRALTSSPAQDPSGDLSGRANRAA